MILTPEKLLLDTEVAHENTIAELRDKNARMSEVRGIISSLLLSLKNMDLCSRNTTRWLTTRRWCEKIFWSNWLANGGRTIS